MSRLRLLSGEFDHNDVETSSIRSKAGSSVSGKSETVRVLNDRLRLESKSRQETDQLYRRLQHEYDDLLARHAQAENTIDQLKIGAKIQLYSDAPPPLEASQVRFVDFKAQSPQKLVFPRSNKAVVSSDQLSSTHNSYNSARHYPLAESSLELEFLKGDRDNNDQQLKTILKLKELQGDIEAFQAALGDRELDYIQQRNLFQVLASQHEQLKSDLLRMKNNQPRGDTDFPVEKPRFPEEFVTPDSLEGEIYRIGLKLEEISDEIGEQLHANDNGNPLNQVLKEDFENLKRSQSFAGTKSFTGDEHAFAADTIVEEVIKADPRLGEDDVFSGSEETDYNIHVINDNERLLRQESERDSSILSDPYAKPNCAWEAGIEDLTESGYYPSTSLIHGELKSKSSALGSLYLAKSPSLDTRIFENKIPSSRPPSVSTRSIGESSSGQSPEKVSPYSRSSLESVICKGDQEREETPLARPTDLEIKSLSTNRVKSKPGSTGSLRTSRRSQSSSSRSNRSESSYSSTPRLTSSPRKEACSDAKEFHHGKNQRYTHIRPGSEGRRSNDRVRAGHLRKDGTSKSKPRSHSGDQKRTDYEESSSSDRETLSETDQRIRLIPQTKLDRATGKAPSSRFMMAKDTKEHSKGFRPNTADSNVDSGFVGSEDSRRSQKYMPGIKAALGDSISTTMGDLQTPQNFHSETQVNRGTPSSRKSSSDGRYNNENQLFRKSSSEVAMENSGENELGEKHIRQNTGSETSGVSGLPVNPTREVLKDSTLHSPADRRLTSRTDSFQSESVLGSPPRRVSSTSTPLRDEIPSTGELYRHQLDKLREKMVKRSPRLSPRRNILDNKYGIPSQPLSVVEESTNSYSKGVSPGAPKSGRHNETQTKMTDQESEKSDRYRRYSFDLMRDEIQRLRSQLADESRLRDLHSQLVEDLRLRQFDLDRSSSWKAAEERQKDMLSDIRQRLDKLTEQVQKPKPSYSSEVDVQDQRRLYDDVRRKIDGLSHDIQRSRERHSTAPTVSPVRGPALDRSHNLFPVCPVCSGTGFHKHGNYVFPRDFLASNSAVRIVPSQDVISLPVTPEPVPVVTSTPINGMTKTVKGPTYRVVQTQPSTYYTTPNTIYHIHKHHNDHNESSSSEESSGSEMQERRRKRRSPRRFKNGNRKWANSELQDYRLHESLDEATKAAREMQRVSKKMLSTIATDLIQVGYDEY